MLGISSTLLSFACARRGDTRLGTFEHKTVGVLQKSHAVNRWKKCCSTGQRLRSLK